MTRRTSFWTALVAIVAVVGASSPAVAQTASEDWKVAVAPYLMGAAMNGTTTVRGNDVNVDLSASDIFSNLQFGAMGMVAARKGNWGVGGDAIWMALGTTGRNTNVDFNQGAFAVYGLRQLAPAAEVAFGLRVNTLQGNLTFKQLGREVDQHKTWVDPVAGVLLRTPEARRAQLRVFTEIGGFGAGSEFTWQIFPTVGFNFVKTFSLELGYRWLDINYASGEGNDHFAYDVLSQGPVFGFAFRF